MTKTTKRYRVAHLGPVTFKWGVQSTVTGQVMRHHFITKREAQALADRMNAKVR